MRWKSLIVGSIATLLLPPCIRADDATPDWNGGPYEYQVRLRGVYLYTGNIDNFGDHLEKRAYPELSGEVFITPRWSAELALTVSTTYRLGNPQAGFDLGGIGLAPQTWTVKYNFAPRETFRPYLGFGAHYTGVSRHYNDRVVGISSSSAGWVAQAGFDARLSQHWYLNTDVRYLGDLEPYDLIGGSRELQYKIDPFLFGVGIGFRFGGARN